MLTRLDNLVIVLAPVLLAKRLETGKAFDGAEEIKLFSAGVVQIARFFETAIADEELRQMTPPKEPSL